MMKAYKRLNILCIAVLLCALLPVLAGATAPENPPEAVDPNAVYVSVNGADTTGDGSQGAPYATLAHAVKVASGKPSATIYVMSDLTMTESARYWSGDITITSAPGAETPYTISRGKDMESVNDSVDPVQDMARGGYNPALIEVGNAASLTLENIVLDDRHIMAYTYEGNEAYTDEDNPVFVQVDASRGGNVGDGNPDNDPGSTTVGKTNVSNFEIVQDAIIATYSGDATITLGDGAVLQNYGGMSAVRVSGGTLVMKAGSKICDSETHTRIRGATDSYGPAGAVWVQSGKVEMQEGSSIEDMNGRAIYEDGAGSNVTVDGAISGITGNANMWFGNDGRVWHLRGNAVGILTGTIENIEQSTNAVYVIYNSNFTMQEGSSLKNINGVGIQMFGNNGGTVTVNGEITGCTNSAIHMNTASAPSGEMIEEDRLHLIIGPTGTVHNNVGNMYGTVTAQVYNGLIDVYGKIHSNYSSDRAGITLATNWGTSTVYLHNGAEISNNVAGGTSGIAVAKGTVYMEDGSLVSDNITTGDERGSGIYIERDGHFIMNGGEVVRNASAGSFGGVAFKSEEYHVSELHPCAILNGGIISNNIMNATIIGTGTDTEAYSVTGGTNSDISVVSGESANIDRYLTISNEVTLSEESIYMQSYDYTIERPREGVKLGNASADGETALKTASENLGWEKDKLIASFWAQSASNETWELNGLTKDNAQLPVYALVMPTDPEGNVAGEAEAAVYAVTIDGDTWRFAVPAGETNGYVVGLVQPTEDYGTLALTVSPTQVTEGEDSHTFQYQAVYTISGSLKNMLDQEPNVGDFTLTFVLDSNLTCTDANDANYDSDTHTLTVTVSADKLDGYTFHFSAETADGITLTAGDQLVTSAVLSGQVGMTQVTVPSAPAVVEVVAQTPVTPPVTPSEPADPDDTGVSDLLDTENHNQYLFGYPEGTFGPDQNMTRAEVAQMFYNLLVDKNVAITASFEDVPADAWYAKSVNTLASMGIISGVGENRFEPERSITRAEFTSMAMKFTKGALDGTNVFSDVHSGDWFYEAVVGSIQYGWIEGYEDGTFRPENRITRVEVTSIVNKMLGRFADREFVAGHADELNSFSDVTSTHWGYYHIVEATNSHTYTKPSTNVETWTELK